MTDSDRKELENVSFPSDLPQDQCISAVLEVREYLLEHDSGTRTEIWEKLILDTNQPSSGRELCRIRGYVPKLRDWWWERIITPGLHELPECEALDAKETVWGSV